MPPQPPRLAEWLLIHALPPGHDALVGDLAEEYVDHVAAYGARRAAWLYWGELFRTIPPFFVNGLRWQRTMLKNYLVVAFRNLRKYKGFSAINVLGLAVSMSVCLLIIALIKDQKSYDQFHEKSDRIYRLVSTVEQSYGSFDMATSPGPLAPALLAESPAVEQAVRFTKMGGNATYDDQTFQVSGLYAEPSFFEVFDFQLGRGNPVTALEAPFSLILSPEAAHKVFGTEDPLGKVIHRDGLGDFVVTGVLAETEHKSHLDVEVLASFSTLETLDSEYLTTSLVSWSQSSVFYNYLVLAEDADPADVAALSNDLVRRNETDAEAHLPALRMQALSRINMGEELSNQIGSLMPASSAYVLVVFACVLMLIAVFNYISLTVARSLKRAREIGIRKVVGARRSQIVWQFLSEAVVVAVLASVLAMVLLMVLVPGFNNLKGFQDDLDFGALSGSVLSDGWLYVLFLGFAVGVGMLAGVVPAFKMASFVPTRVLKGLTATRGFSRFTLRRVLIVFQFSLAIIGIVTTLTINGQLAFLLQADYGIDEEQLVTIDLQDMPYETMRDELLRVPGVEQVAMTSSMPVSGSKTWTDIQAPGSDAPELMMFYSVDADFLTQFRLRVVAGRGLAESFSESEAQEPIWLTQQAVKALNLGTPEEAIGQVLPFDSGPEPHTGLVVGVVSDIYARGYEKGYEPVVLRHLPERFNYAVVRIRPGNLKTTLAALETTWKRVAPTLAFNYAFYDDEIAQQYLFMQDLVKFFGLMAGFVVFIACLGLLGMASYTVETRTKEVGIRKVLGADVRSVVLLLSRDYLTLLAVAVVLATPLAYLLNHVLLQDFAHHISLGLGLFLAGILPILALALLTIGSQTLKAGYTNPVDTLRSE